MKNKLGRLAFLAAAIAAPAQATEISTNTAQMQAMDKITGEVSVINVPINTVVRFGSFSILVRACKTRPPEETPENFAFVDVVDITNGKENINIFKGWMMSSSPALNAIEHPVYDVWLLRCINNEDASAQKPMTEDELQARDYIELARPQKKETTTTSNDDNNTNLSGEPIDLLPAAIQEISNEEKAQAEVIKLEVPSEPETVATEEQTAVGNQPGEESPVEAGAPQPLFAPVEKATAPAVAATKEPVQPKNETPLGAEQANIPAEAEDTKAEAAIGQSSAIKETDVPSATTTEQKEKTVTPRVEASPVQQPQPAEAETADDDTDEIIINLENELSNEMLNN